ncbi:MAG: type III pantothenate kinase [Lentimicrobiaceae bacterium]|jgi:type III pantothenate kinase
MNLVIDTGNTLTKLALFQGREMVSFSNFEGVDAKQIVKFCDSNLLIKNAILSAVKEYPSEIDEFLSQRYKTVFFSHHTSVPILNKYSTPETLGKDRLAGVVGAQQLFPASDNLVIDAGTAITYDLITAAGEYLGGAISPGIAMRYKALHTFTSRLPLLDYYNNAQLIGDDTSTCIHSGVLNGAVAEMEGIIQRYQLLYPALKIILTGGDHNYFDKRLKIKTFAAPNLVLGGLNLILDFNIETH